MLVVHRGATLSIAGMAALIATSFTNVIPAHATPLATQSQTFSYTGGPQSFIVPAGVSSLGVIASGAGGTAGTSNGGAGGAGALVEGSMKVTPGQVWTIDVGGRGSGTAGGWGGYSGGNGGGEGTGADGGGGGATTINDGRAYYPAVILGGGGGGGGGWWLGCAGGSGGVGGDISNTGSLATNGLSGNCLYGGAGGFANEIPGDAYGANGGSNTSDGYGGGGGAGALGGSAGFGSYYGQANGGGGGGGSLAGPIQNTGIGQASSVTNGSVTFLWSSDQSNSVAKINRQSDSTLSNRVPQTPSLRRIASL